MPYNFCTEIFVFFELKIITFNTDMKHVFDNFHFKINLKNWIFSLSSVCLKSSGNNECSESNGGYFNSNSV